ncbi:MAG: hypothetical protein ABWW70_05730 [Thermoproteota archaeon]
MRSSRLAGIVGLLVPRLVALYLLYALATSLDRYVEVWKLYSPETSIIGSFVGGFAVIVTLALLLYPNPYTVAIAAVMHFALGVVNRLLLGILLLLVLGLDVYANVSSSSNRALVTVRYDRAYRRVASIASILFVSLLAASIVSVLAYAIANSIVSGLEERTPATAPLVEFLRTPLGILMATGLATSLMYVQLSSILEAVAYYVKPSREAARAALRDVESLELGVRGPLGAVFVGLVALLMAPFLYALVSAGFGLPPASAGGQISVARRVAVSLASYLVSFVTIRFGLAAALYGEVRRGNILLSAGALLAIGAAYVLGLASGALNVSKLNEATLAFYDNVLYILELLTNIIGLAP